LEQGAGRARPVQRELPPCLAPAAPSTEGFIAFARRDLVWILARWTPASRVVLRG
jgi:hypothetical protein